MFAKTLASWMVVVITVLISLGGCALQQDLVVLNDQVIALEEKAEADRASLRSEVKRYHEDQL